MKPLRVSELKLIRCRRKIDELEREILQLEIERQALQREEDENRKRG